MSISVWQFSGPLRTTHSSRTFLVSGQAQHILSLGCSWAGCVVGVFCPSSCELILRFFGAEFQVLCNPRHMDKVPKSIKTNGTKEKGHTFASHSFKKPTWCETCHDFIWGLSRQGYKCKGMSTVESGLTNSVQNASSQKVCGRSQQQDKLQHRTLYSWPWGLQVLRVFWS